MANLPLSIYSAAQVRALDHHAIEDLHIPGYTLMSTAAEVSLRALRSCWPAAQNMVVLCGPGNNGGDGYVLARLARAQRLNVQVVAMSPPETLQGDALRA